MKPKLLIFLFFLTSLYKVSAQEHENELRIFYGIGQSAIKQFNAPDSKETIKYEDFRTTKSDPIGIGYRGVFEKFSIGIDIGFSNFKKEYFAKKQESMPTQTNYLYCFTIMPAAEIVYYQKNAFVLYGAASTGVLFVDGKNNAKSNLKSSPVFAYQVNPAGIKIRNNKIGAFLELGYGHKGSLIIGALFML